MAESLRNRTIKGTFWSGIDNIVNVGVTFVVSIVLARLLSPDDYGLIGIIAIFTEVCMALVNGGFTTALIRKKDATDDDYNTAFIVNFVVSVVLYIIIFLSSPFIASFFGRDELIDLTRVASFGLIIGAMSLVQQTRLTKLLDFKSLTKITITASVSSGIIGILMALYGLGVWALVGQQLINHVLRTILLWIVNKWIPNFHFSRKSFHELFGFGWKMMISSLIDTIWKELYQVVVGKFYSPATLGQYTRSKQFAKLFSTNLTQIVQRVTYPVLSNIQDDKERMVAAYRKIIKMSVFITIISLFFLGAISEPLIFCLIGPKWSEASTYLPLICIGGSLYPLHAINLNMLQVLGRSDLFLGLEVIKKILYLGPLALGVFVGIMPMLYTNIIVSVIAFFLNSNYSGKYLGYSSWMQIKDIAPSFWIATVVAFVVYFMKYLPVTFWVILPVQIVFGLVLIFLICRIAKIDEMVELIDIVKPYVKLIKK